MRERQIESEMQLFKLLYILLIFFSLLVLRVVLGIGGKEVIFMQAEIPEMVLALVSSLLILSFEAVLWYIVRVKKKSINLFHSKKK